MDFEDPGKFEDPALKSALRRTFAMQAAPAELRERMQHMLGGSSMSITGQMSRGRSIILGFSAAAVVLLSVALVATQVRNYVMNPAPAKAAAMPETLAAKLTATHDKCLAAADHHLVAAADSAALATSLTDDLGFKVFIPTLGSEWSFKGAGECRVGEMRTAHLLYHRGQSDVSVFALPTEAISSCGSSTYYESTVANHPMIGLASRETLYAIVGSNTAQNMAMSELRAVASQVQGCLPSQCRTATVAVAAR